MSSPGITTEQERLPPPLSAAAETALLTDLATVEISATRLGPPPALVIVGRRRSGARALMAAVALLLLICAVGAAAVVAVIATATRDVPSGRLQAVVRLSPVQRRTLAAWDARAAAIAQLRRDRGTDAVLEDVVPPAPPQPTVLVTAGSVTVRPR